MQSTTAVQRNSGSCLCIILEGVKIWSATCSTKLEYDYVFTSGDAVKPWVLSSDSVTDSTFFNPTILSKSSGWSFIIATHPSKPTSYDWVISCRLRWACQSTKWKDSSLLFKIIIANSTVVVKIKVHEVALRSSRPGMIKILKTYNKSDWSTILKSY